MYILIPMDDADIEEAKITKLEDVKVWAQVLVESGKILEIDHKEDKDSFENQSHIVVVNNDNEYVWPFIEQNMLVLVAHFQKSIDDIVEAYLFKELNELAY